jgi:dipeptidyl aminopeptidase/acylaminoacyl peptidase
VDLDGANRLWLVPPAKNFERRSVTFDAQIQDRVISWLPEDEEHILLQLNRDQANRPGVYALDIYTNELSRVKRARSKVRRWYATHAGDVKLAIGYRGGSEGVLYAVNGRRLKDFYRPEFNSEITPQPLGFAADLTSFYLSMTNGEDRHGIYRVDIQSGEVLETFYQDPKFDVFGRVILHPETGVAAGVSYVAHHPRQVLFDEDLARLFERMRARVPGSQMSVISTDAAYNKFVLYTYGAIAPRYYLYNHMDDSLDLIGADYPDLDDADVVDLQPVLYAAADGANIPAYLATPRKPGPHPTVLLPHGGPYARDSAEFDAWTQLLVNQGFAVLKPNYRGSVGYGELHMQAGYRQWGLKMQQDLMDGLDWLVAQGIADPERVCMVGASYGGYTALVSAYKSADRIKCVVSLAGISDLEKTVQRIYDFDLQKRNRARIQSSAKIAENSPQRQVHAINVPVLLFHGDQDTIVRVKQSRDFAAALARHGKPHRYIEQPNGDHFLSYASQREEFFAEMVRFLSEHLQHGALKD